MNALDALENANGVIIVTEWQEFSVIDLKEIARMLKDKAVFDGRNIFDTEKAKAAGLSYVSIGRNIKEEIV